jgi:hypothetical protein
LGLSIDIFLPDKDKDLSGELSLFSSSWAFMLFLFSLFSSCCLRIFKQSYFSASASFKDSTSSLSEKISFF